MKYLKWDKKFKQFDLVIDAGMDGINPSTVLSFDNDSAIICRVKRILLSLIGPCLSILLKKMAPTVDEMRDALAWCTQKDGRPDFATIEALPVFDQLGISLEEVLHE